MDSEWKVIVTDHVFPDLSLVEEECRTIGVTPHLLQTKQSEQLLEHIKDADAVLTCYKPITDDVIDNLSKCRIIARFGIGVDNVDLKAATAKGILVTNVPDYCVDEVSDHTLALVLAWYRKIAALNRRVHDGEWDYQPERPIHRVRGQVLGVFGLGHIGREVVRKARSFGFRIVASDPYVTSQQAQDVGAELVSLESLLEQSDVLALHAPLTSETMHVIDGEALARMKPTALLVNTARGGLVDTEALVEALDKGRIGGACLDVLEGEMEGPNDALRGRNNVILTPHVGFYSEGAVQDLQRKAARQVVKVLAGQTPDYVVNKDVLENQIGA